MKSLVQISSAIAGLMFLGGLAFAQEPASIAPNTPEAANAMQELREAKVADQGNARSFSDSDSSLDHYYARKAREVDHLIKQLEQGQTISKAQMEQALNTDRAATYAPMY